ncbi:bZIP transcription factor [Legionella spiritensis]|uniref:BZIP transcription factor n=1 Tax=Legionella spiritensis TaxID=452 RepID=A0A0W0Z5X0_LEGSP|nr:bZIP transcription factor [Legionella spiritensis]KTD64556.1 bZIP transcription factor [Legionella spiritensis]SNV29777.1 bZIP transcription factor [Legionella spiritensis]
MLDFEKHTTMQNKLKQELLKFQDDSNTSDLLLLIETQQERLSYLTASVLHFPSQPLDTDSTFTTYYNDYVTDYATQRFMVRIFHNELLALMPELSGSDFHLSEHSYLSNVEESLFPGIYDIWPEDILPAPDCSIVSSPYKNPAPTFFSTPSAQPSKRKRGCESDNTTTDHKLSSQYDGTHEPERKRLEQLKSKGNNATQEEKEEKRRLSNKLNARKSREKQKNYTISLEREVATLKQENEQLRAENARLKQMNQSNHDGGAATSPAHFTM